MGYNVIEIPVIYETEESVEYDKILSLNKGDNEDYKITVEEVYESLSISKIHGVLVNIDNIASIEHYMKNGEPLEGYCYLCLGSEDYIVNMTRDELHEYILNKCRK